VVIDESTGKVVSVALPTYGMIVGRLVIATPKAEVPVPGTVSLIGASSGARRFGTDENGTFIIPSSVGIYVFSGHSPRSTVGAHPGSARNETTKGTCHSAPFAIKKRETIHVTIVCKGR
jgi:hypothetical protein